MAWIQSHQELRTHPKTLRLARLLSVSPITAIGHLHCLWWWCLDYAQHGDLSTFDHLDIAIAAGWDGDADTFIAAMESAGFLDVDAFTISVHDWPEYGGRLIERREKNAECMRAARSDAVQDTCNARAEHVNARARLEKSKRREEKSREEDIKTVSALSREKKRTTAFPEHFDPPYDWADSELGMSPLVVDRHVERMRDWALSKGETRKDWTAFARNWLRKAHDDPQPRAGPNGATAQSKHERTMAIARGDIQL